MLPFTETGEITSPWERIHLEFCTICLLSYFFSSLCFPTILTLALFPNLLSTPTVFHPFCLPSQYLLSRAADPHSISYATTLSQYIHVAYHNTHLYAHKPTVISGNQARTVLLMCTDVSSTPTHWHHHHDPSLPSSKARINIKKISPLHAWYHFRY